MRKGNMMEDSRGSPLKACDSKSCSTDRLLLCFASFVATYLPVFFLIFLSSPIQSNLPELKVMMTAVYCCMLLLIVNSKKRWDCLLKCFV